MYASITFLLGHDGVHYEGMRGFEAFLNIAPKNCLYIEEWLGNDLRLESWSTTE